MKRFPQSGPSDLCHQLEHPTQHDRTFTILVLPRSEEELVGALPDMPFLDLKSQLQLTTQFHSHHGGRYSHN
uniref:Uncharacterized protein n=1 Tax=Arundo donax TaxID=35708 RepID=A0A0A8ZNB2_ARUDO